MARWIQQQSIDVMHTHMSSAHLFGIIMKMMTGTPVVATAHQCSLQLHWRFNNHVIANSEYTRRFQQRINGVPANRLSKIHCFSALDRFRTISERDVNTVRGQLRLKGHEFVVGVVGDVVARKGHRYLFQALPRVLQEVPELKLVLLGRFNRSETYVRKLRQLQQQAPLLTKIKWLGLRDNVQDFMSAFDLCVVPSVEEPLGLVAIEALAAGTAVVASNTGGLPEIVRNGENGLLVPPRDSNALADAIIALARDADLRERMGQRGRSMVFETFDPGPPGRPSRGGLSIFETRFPSGRLTWPPANRAAFDTGVALGGAGDCNRLGLTPDLSFAGRPISNL